MYADDLKLIYPVKCVLDSLTLQCDLNALYWCQINRLNLNIAKCKIMTFHRYRSPIIFEYLIDGVSLERVVKKMKDLGVFYDKKL